MTTRERNTFECQEMTVLMKDQGLGAWSGAPGASPGSVGSRSGQLHLLIFPIVPTWAGWPAVRSLSIEKALKVASANPFP